MDNIITPEFRVSYPYLFRPQKPMDENGTPKYSLVMLFKLGEDLSKLKAAAKQACVDKWGADAAKWPKGLHTPFRDQGEKSSEGYVPGAIFVTATSKQKPGLVDAAVQPIIDESQFYAGCYAIAELRAFTYDRGVKKGVGFGLQNVQKKRDGESLSGRNKPEEVFKPIEGAGVVGATDGDSDPFA